MMRRKHRLLPVLLALALLLGTAALPAAAETEGNTLLASTLSTQEKADFLYELGLIAGTGTNADGTPNFGLEGGVDRRSGAVMLVRLLGKDAKAQAQYATGAVSSSFTDLSWEAPWVTWLFANGLVNGTDAANTKYSGTAAMTAAQFATLILRALGYKDTGDKPDFSWAQPMDFAVEKQLITEEQRKAFEVDFTRAGIMEMCYNALYLKMNDSSLTLLEKLTNDGIFKDSYKNNASVSGTKTMTLTEKYSGGGFIGTGVWYPEEQTEGSTVCASDLDGDGKLEIVFGVQSVYCVNAADGSLKWKVDASSLGGGYTRDRRAPFQILDWDGDNQLEIFAMNFSDPKGYVNIIDKSGTVEKKWTIDTGYQIRAVCPADLDGDGKYELVIGVGTGEAGDKKGDSAVYVYNNDGTLRWSQPQGYGLFSNSITTVDLDGDGKQEIILTYDETQIVAFHSDGTRVAAPAFGSGVTWDKVHFFSNRDTDKYGRDDLTTGDYRDGIMGTYSGLIADDLDGDGKKEIIGVTMINDTLVTFDNMNGEVTVNSFAGAAKYFAPYIINLDRTRYVNASKGYDWSRIPTDTGTIYTLYGEILSNPGTTVGIIDPDYRPVTADLDGDGVKEILYTASDGQVHCFSLDGTEHGAWPFALNSRSTDLPNHLRYASRPEVADVNGDGKLEVIFTTYSTTSQTDERGKLYVLDYTGKKLAEIELPPFYMRESDDGTYANGCNATPIVADIDGDKKLEIVVMTFSCGLVAYEIN